MERKKKKKNPLQYLLKAQFFILWTFLGLGCDNWWGGNIVLGPTEATFFFIIYFLKILNLWLLLKMIIFIIKLKHQLVYSVGGD